MTETLQKLSAVWWLRIIGFIILTVVISLLLNAIPGLNIYNEYNWLFSLLIASLLIESARKSGAWFTIGFRIDRYTARDIAWGLALALIPMLIILIIGIVLGGSFSLNNVDIEFNSFFLISATILIYAAVEELIFRGLIFQSLLERFSKGLIVIIFSILFSFAHFYNPYINSLAYFNIFLVGVLISIMYINTLSLWLPISFHFFWNWLESVMLSSPISGVNFGIEIGRMDTSNINPNLLFLLGGDFGIEQGLLTTIIILSLFYPLFKSIIPSPYMSAILFKRTYSESEIKSGKIEV